MLKDKNDAEIKKGDLILLYGKCQFRVFEENGQLGIKRQGKFFPFGNLRRAQELQISVKK